MPFANLDSTAARIAKMLPPARAQFAQMHKADPIMMSLVSFVDNQEKAFLAANLARQAGTEPPKVNDQIIASINPQAPQGMPQGAPQAAQQLPENTGIAALPAPNMQQMADGGITGYQDDLYVPDDSDARMGNGGYNFPQGEAVIRMADGTPPEMFFSPEESLSTYTQAEPTSREEQIYKEADAYRQRFQPKISKERELEDKQLAEFDAATKMFERDNKQKAAPQAPSAASRLMPQRTMAAPSAGQSLEDAYKRRISEPTVDPYAVDRQGISDFATSAAEKRREQLAKDIAERGEAFKGAEDRVSKREQGLGKMEDRETGLALLAAGAAMMSTPGGFARAFGKGVQVGASQYGEGMAKIESAKQKIDDARDKIEEYRRTEKMMTAKERAEAEKDFTQTTISAKNSMLAGLEKAGADKKAVAQFFTQIDANKEAAKIKAAADAANARASGMPGLAREIAAASPEQAKRLLNASAQIQGQDLKAQTAHEKLLASDSAYKNMFMQFAFETDPKKQAAIESQINNYLTTKRRIEGAAGSNPQNAFPGFKIVSP